MVVRRSWLGPLAAAVVMVVVVGALYLSGREGPAPEVAANGPTLRPAAVQATATPLFDDAYKTFMEVRNDCGVCGTDSPIGGWESEDGHTLVLAEDHTFLLTAPNGVEDSGRWRLKGEELCLDALCLAYEQRVDAMRLGSRIYIRW